MSPPDTIKKFVKKTLSIDPELSIYVFRNITREYQFNVEITKEDKEFTGQILKFLVDKEDKKYVWRLISRNFPNPNFDELKTIYDICYNNFKRGTIERKLSS